MPRCALPVSTVSFLLTLYLLSANKTGSTLQPPALRCPTKETSTTHLHTHSTIQYTNSHNTTYYAQQGERKGGTPFGINRSSIRVTSHDPGHNGRTTPYHTKQTYYTPPIQALNPHLKLTTTHKQPPPSPPSSICPTHQSNKMCQTKNKKGLNLSRNIVQRGTLCTRAQYLRNTHPHLRLAPSYSAGTGIHGDSSARNRSVLVGEEKTVWYCASGVSMTGDGRGFFFSRPTLF